MFEMWVRAWWPFPVLSTAGLGAGAHRRNADVLAAAGMGLIALESIATSGANACLLEA
jgi:hypothetical protein